MTRYSPSQGWLHIRRPLVSVLLGTVLLGALSGCAGVLVGGAVLGTVAASDRRTFGAQTEDKAIAVKGDLGMSAIVGDAGHVNVNSFNRKVLLTGEVRDAAMKANVHAEIAGISGVSSIANELEVTDLSSYSSRGNDALITTKVKASLFDMRDISGYSFKVVTERGIVYLMGRVTQREGNIASDVARGVGGVQQVVKVFEYITDQDVQQMQSASAP
ncbi:MAG: osmotically-inducible protein OsmY [Janthinobacterium sp.]|jgi:osmotically-inducible protein OsmY